MVVSLPSGDRRGESKCHCSAVRTVWEVKSCRTAWNVGTAVEKSIVRIYLRNICEQPTRYGDPTEAEASSNEDGR
jgi:hypothetical protein